MNTPPPSSGVKAPDGYKTDTGTMSSAGRNISTKAEDTKDDVDQVKPAKVQAAEFGQHADHQAYQKDYAAAIEQLGGGAVAMCDNLVAFAANLGGTATSYTEREAGAKSTVTAPGSGT